MMRPNVVGVLCSCVLVACGAASPSEPTSDVGALHETAAWKNLSAADFHVDDPPSKDSSTYADDIRAVRAAAASRDPAHCEFANEHFDYDYTVMWHGFLSDEEIARTKPFLEKVFAVTDTVVTAFKRRFARGYPFTELPDFRPCVPATPGSGSYPSGHAAGGVTSACVLAKIFPERAAEIEAYGKRQGDLRIEIGRHYPTDVTAGDRLGHDICDKLLSDDDVREQIEAAKRR